MPDDHPSQRTPSRRTHESKIWNVPTEQEYWLRHNLDFFERIFANERQIESLMDVVVNDIAPLISADYGSIYLVDDEHDPGVFADIYHDIHPTLPRRPKRHKPDRKISKNIVTNGCQFVVRNMPYEHVINHSSRNEMPPVNMYVYAITHADTTLAILELATFDDFERIQQIFINKLCASLGVAIARICNTGREGSYN